jgi:D-3-phosphoglycerate dehydrogenase / 2-oxoglutarate reductase
MMLSGRVARLGGQRSSLSSALWAATGICCHQPPLVLRRNFADVEVDHARGQWKTYGNLESYKPGKHHILTFNKISPIGLQHFPSAQYDIFASEAEQAGGANSNAHAILLRSHKLKEEQVPHTVRAIAR